MIQNYKSLSLLLIILLLGAPSLAQATDTTPLTASTSKPNLPEHVDPQEPNNIQPAILQAEYQYTWHQPSAAYLAPNRAHGWYTAASPEGVNITAVGDANWHWRLTLHTYGYADALQTLTTPPVQTANANRIEYQWNTDLGEWYVNDEKGLKQGFSLAAPPQSAPTQSPLVFEMRLDTNLSATLSANGQVMILQDAHGINTLRYDSLQVTDANNKTLPAHLELPANHTLRIVVDDNQAIYPLTVDPLLTSLTTKLTASDASELVEFGYSVDVSGDTIVVSQWRDGQIAPDAGAVYIFERNQDGTDAWGEVIKITAFDAAAGDWFGHSVGISDDTIAVGAFYDDDAGGSCGAVYVYERNQGGPDNWGHVAKLLGHDTAGGDRLGIDVDIDGDKIVAGAWRDDDDGNSSGSAYVFERNQGGPNNWGQVVKLTASDAEAWDLFGRAVAVSGDTVAIGAYSNSDNGNSSGSAYIFERNLGGPDNWGEVTKILASDGAAFDEFGFDLALNNDTLAVGARYHDLPSQDVGAVYVYERNQGGADNWGEVIKLSAADGALNDFFGHTVSINGNTIVVGSSGDDDHGIQSGSACMFERNQGGADNWGQVVKLTAPDGAESDFFGNAVAVNGNTLIIGAPYNDDDGSESGSAYIFVRQGDTWAPIAQPIANDGADGDEFGWAISISDDTLVVGAWANDGAANDAGAAYVFTRNQDEADGWGQALKLTADDAAEADEFGHAVAVSGNTIVVGAPYNDDAGVQSGSAYVFERNLGGPDNWGQVTKLTADDAASSDEFGYAVSLNGDTLAIGAPYNDMVYIFTRNGGGAPDDWGQIAKLVGDDTIAGNQFGHAVSVNADTLVVGAPTEQGGGNTSGAACVFERNGDGAADDWGQMAKLTAFDAVQYEEFGLAVSVSGDTVVVGAPADSNDGNNSGSVYVFTRNGGGVADDWGLADKLIADDAGEGDHFGAAIAIDNSTLAVGAFGQDQADDNAGAVYVFERNGGGGADDWGQTAKLLASNAAANDDFGWSVSLNGNTLAVGAHVGDGAASDSGSAYIYQLNQWAPDLALHKTVSPLIAAPGDPVTFTLSFANVGVAPASGVLITDPLPLGVTNVSIISSSAAITEITPGYVWAVEDLDVGEGGVITIAGALAIPLAVGALVNDAQIATANQDIVANNNHSQARLTVLDLPPVANDDNYTGPTDATLQIDAPGVLENDFDPNNDPFIAVLDSQPVTGSLIFGLYGNLSYTPPPDFNGVVTFTYHANQAQGNSNTAVVTLTITPENNVPLAVGESYTTAANNPLIVPAPGVLTNDRDIDGDELSAILDAAPSSGDLALNADGSLVYTPTLGFTGTDHFIYHAFDGLSDSNTATVTLHVEPDACLPLESINILGETSGAPGEYTFNSEYTRTNASLPVNYLWDNGDTTHFTMRNLDLGVHTLAITATNCPQRGSLWDDDISVTDSHTITITQEQACTPVSTVTLNYTHTGTLYLDNLVYFTADLQPNDASPHYHHIVTINDQAGEAMSDSTEPLTFQHTFGSVGAHWVEIAVWNCDMTLPNVVTASLQVNVVSSGYSLYLPIVVKNN